MHTRRQTPPPLLVGAALVSISLISIPLVYLAVRVAEGGIDAWSMLLTRPRVPLLVTNTLVLGTSVTLAAVLIGVPSAFLLSRVNIRARPFWMIIAAAPLAIPSYLSAYGLLALFPFMQGFWASWLVLTMVSVPFVTLPVATLLRNSSTDLEDVARTLGRTALRARFAGAWHQIRAATLAGALLTFLYTIADFGGVSLFRFPVLTTAIQQAYGSSFDRSYAASLSLILVGIALAVVVAERFARGRVRRTISSQRTTGKTRTLPLSPALLPLFGLLALPAFVAVVLPATLLLQRMALAGTLVEINIPRLAAATGNTIVLSALGAIIAIMFATPIAFVTARYRTRFTKTLDALSHLPLALPGIVLGLSLVLFALSVVPMFYQTVLLLSFGYAVLYMPKVIGSVRARIISIPSSLDDVAQSLGYTKTQRVRSVFLRLTRPGFILGGLLVAVAAMKELPATLMLRPTGVDTLATMLWSRTDVSQYGAGAPYAILLLLVASVPAFILSQADRTNGSSS